MNTSDRRNFWKWLVIGGGVTFVGFVTFVAFILALVFGSIRKSIPYQEAVERARSDARVVEILGAPIEHGFFVRHWTSGTVGKRVLATMTIPISGPKGKGSIRVRAVWTPDHWRYEEMTVIPKKGEPIDLLTSSEGSTSTAPPAA